MVAESYAKEYGSDSHLLSFADLIGDYFASGSLDTNLKARSSYFYFSRAFFQLCLSACLFLNRVGAACRFGTYARRDVCKFIVGTRRAYPLVRLYVLFLSLSYASVCVCVFSSRDGIVYLQ